MKDFLHILRGSPLFTGIAFDELEAMLGCLAPTRGSYEKGAFILRMGDEVDTVGLLLDGSAHIITEDFWGNRNIIAMISPGELFAEVYACTPGRALGVSVVAEKNCHALFLDVRRILGVCPSGCEFHSKLIRNLLSALAEKNLIMNAKLSHMSERTTRGKLTSYLSGEAKKNGSPTFEIPFNRRQLAEYLSVDRSAMSAELSRMRDDGILEFDRNRFTLIAVE